MAGAPLELVLEALGGAVFFRVVLEGEELGDRIVDDLVTLVLEGVGPS